MVKRKPLPQADPASWTHRDSVLFASCQIIADLRAGRIASRPQLAHTFTLSLGGDNERLLASGNYLLDWWGRTGNGSYSTSSFIAGGTGALGIGLLAATAISSSSRNSAARSNAAAAATVMWPARRRQHRSHHELRLLPHRRTPRIPLIRMGLDHEGDLDYQGMFRFQANMRTGTTEQFMIRSDWAELIFVCWTLARNQGHPRLQANTWLGPAFIDKCRRHQYSVPTAALT